MKIGRLILTAIVAFLLFLFIAIDLVLFGVIPLNSPLVTILPVVGVLLAILFGIVGGVKAGKRKQGAMQAAPMEMQPPMA